MTKNEKLTWTAEELKAVEDYRKYYVCQLCGNRGTDQNDFKMIVMLNTIGVVVCETCPRKEER